MTIKKQLLYTIILSTLIPMIVMPFMGYFYIRDVVKEQLLWQSRQQIEEIAQDTEDVLDDMLQVSNLVSVDVTIRNILRDSKSSVQNSSQVRTMLSNLNAAYLYRYNAAVSIYDEYGRVYSTLGVEQDEQADFRLEWVKETIENQAYFLWKTFSQITPEDPILGLSRNLYDQNGKRTGTLCIELYGDRYLGRMLQQDSDLNHTERYLVDEDGHFILSYTNGEEAHLTEKGYEESGMEAEIVIGSERYILLRDQIERSGWELVQIVPYNEVFAKLIYYRNFTYISNFLGLAALILIAAYTTSKIGKSLTCLGQAMKQVRKGNFITLDNHEKNLEMKQIYDDFNNMSTKLDILFKENRRITKEKEECRLLALQTQIQPHFLLNTLNGIKWLCIIESAPTAERMIGSLGYILEYSLGKTKDCITLEEEIECLRHYIELQKMRYGNTFDVEYRIDETLKLLQVPVLILQPLVENSIIHGIREMEERGFICIAACWMGNRVCLSVEDNGEGMEPERIRQVMNGVGSTDSIGIVNVKERMELYYRDSKFEILSEKGKGTKTQMIFSAGGRTNENSDCG